MTGRNVNTLTFVLCIKIVRRIQARARFKSEDTLVQGAIALHLFIMAYLIFTILFPIAVFVFSMSTDRIFYFVMGGFLSGYAYTYLKILRNDRWKDLEQSVDIAFLKTQRDRIFGIMSIVFFIYYSLTLTAFIAFVSCK